MRHLPASILDIIGLHSKINAEVNAIVGRSSSTSYRKLWTQACAVSAHVRAMGICPGSVIGVMLDDLDSAISSILGIMHAGCVYCPIDTGMTSGRKQQLLQAAKAALVITDGAGIHSITDVKTTLYEQIGFAPTLEPIRFPVAYVMFTSGSTGQPKGVAISHDNLLSAYRQWNERYKLGEIKSHLQTASLSFDVSTGDWLRALCSGATLHAAEWRLEDPPERLIDFIQTCRAECAEFTPMMIRKIYGAALQGGIVLDSVKLLITGSDTMRARELKAIRAIVSPDCRLVFSYGTTETTIDTTYYEPSLSELDAMPDEDVLPIGIPFPGSELKILDEQGCSVRRGSIGELFIGGAGVGLGYITHDSRTAGRYLRALPGQRPGRWYRTGDLASFDGKYYKLHGRADARIKVKGRFVDLTEVEGVLREHCDVLDCAITTVPDGDELNLAVAIAPAPGAVPNPGQLSDFLQRKTGQVVMANHIWFMPKLPATLSGKVDRRALHVLATGQLMGGA